MVIIVDFEIIMFGGEEFLRQQPNNIFSIDTSLDHAYLMFMSCLIVLFHIEIQTNRAPIEYRCSLLIATQPNFNFRFFFLISS